MIIKLFAVLDSASGVYDGPVPSNTEGTAMRSFTNMARNPDSPIGQNPSDFSLWYLGDYNDATGELSAAAKKCLAHAVDVIPLDDETLKEVN